MKTSTLVIGANGMQGKAIVAALRKANHEVFPFVTSKNSLQAWSSSHVMARIGDLSDVVSIDNALRDMDNVVITFPLSFDTALLAQYAYNVINALQRHQIKTIVHNTSTWYPHYKTGVLIHDIKQAIESQFESSRLPVITLKPVLYFENIAGPWSLPSIVNHGVLAYPVTASQEIWWISHADLARFATMALEQPQLAGKKFSIGSSLITGTHMAETISAKIGRPITFASITPRDFERQLRPVFGDTSEKIAESYRFIQDHAALYESINVDETFKHFSIEPLSFEAWCDTVNWQEFANA